MLTVAKNDDSEACTNRVVTEPTKCRLLKTLCKSKSYHTPYAK